MTPKKKAIKWRKWANYDRQVTPIIPTASDEEIKQMCETVRKVKRA